MNIKWCAFAILLIAATNLHATVEIWNWAYITKKGDDLRAGDGASIFQLQDATRSGPMHAQKDTMKLNFTIDGSHVRGSLAPETYRGETIQLEGEITRTKTGGEFPCLETIRMSNGVHHVVLDRSPKSCEP